MEDLSVHVKITEDELLSKIFKAEIQQYIDKNIKPAIKKLVENIKENK